MTNSDVHPRLQQECKTAKVIALTLTPDEASMIGEALGDWSATKEKVAKRISTSPGYEKNMELSRRAHAMSLELNAAHTNWYGKRLKELQDG
jgi:hypothetical protein